MSRRHGACLCAWRRKPLWARGRDRARAQLTRECDTATMGAPRQGVNSATRVRGPSTGARTQSLPRPRSARPRHGAGACPAHLSRAGPSIAGAQLIAPRCCGRARVRARSRGVPIVGGQDTPQRCPAVHTGCAAPSHHHPPKQASGCPQPTARPSGRCGQPEANPPPCPCEQEGGSVATASDRHVVRIVPRCRPRRCGRSSGKGFPCGTPGIPLSDLWSHRE